MARLSLWLLGPLRAELDGQPITGFAYDKLRALLAYLAVESHRGHPREALAGLLWPERPEPVARKNLSQALFHLRRAIADQDAQPPFLLVTHDAIRFNPASDHWLDVAAFDDLADAYLRQPPTQPDPGDIAHLARALELYRGSFLQSFFIPDSAAFEEWALLQRERLHRQAMDLLCLVATACEAVGQIERALTYARRQLELDSWREESHQQVMRLLAVGGRRSEALAQYGACRRVLAQELAVEPGAETTRLYEQIRDGVLVSGGAAGLKSSGEEVLSSAPPPLCPSAPQHNLPPDPTPFIGRERELAQVAERCADPACRLLTIVGPGGVGKTRLAIQAAREQGERFRDGVFFVDLAPVRSADLLANAILRALDAPSEGAVAADERLLAYLAGKQMLVVLDNFEHLLDGSGQESGDRNQGSEDGTGLLLAILHRAPEINLLVTSRERLNLLEEWLAPVDGLEAPGDLEHEDTKAYEDREARRARSDAAESSRSPAPHAVGGVVDSAPLRAFAIQPATLEQYSATALFLACVRRLRPDFQPTSDDAHHIVRICRLLEGMPLGIELAAPWAGKLPLDQIADELGSGLDLLATTLRDMPPRHRSMRAAFDRSWRLLSARERGILRQLSVLRGGFTREAADAVAGASAADLSELCDSSWLRAELSGRYAMHELIRHYCGERLAAQYEADAGETAAQVRDRHCAYYAGYLGLRESQMNWRISVMADLVPEAGNLDAAWRWACENGDYEMGRALVMGHYFMAEMQGRYDVTIQLLDAAARSLRRPRAGGAPSLTRQETGLLLGWVLLVQSALHWHLGMLARGLACINECLEILYDLHPDARQEELSGYARERVTDFIQVQGDYAAAARFWRERLAYLQTTGGPYWPYVTEVGSRFIEANAYMRLGQAMWNTGAYAEAQRVFRRSLELREQIGEQRLKAHGLGFLSGVLRTLGAYDEAERLARAGLVLSQAQGDRIGVARSHEALGAVLMAVGRHEDSTANYEESLVIARESGNHGLLVKDLNGLGALALARGDLEDAGRFYGESQASIERLGIVGTAGYAGAVTGLGNVALAGCDLPQARAHFRAALAARACTAWEKIDVIAGLAQVCAIEGHVCCGVELLAFVAAHPFTSAATRERTRALLRKLAAELPPADFAAATSRGRALQIEKVVAQLVKEREQKV